MNKKGFTLTELLVVVVILGIISGLSIPLIRNLTSSFEKKKYQNYAESVLAASKLYNDSYSEDLFGHNVYGCAYITYDKLVEKKLISDIEVDQMSCNSSKTYVRVTKLDDKYGYKVYLSCGKKTTGKITETEVSIPSSIPEMNNELCGAADGKANIIITADETQKTDVYDKNRKKTVLKIESSTGLENKIEIKAKWSQNANDRSDSGFNTVSFKVKGNQEEILLSGDTIKTESKELVSPAGTGDFYLIVRVDYLKDLYGHSWVNKDNPNSKFVVFGPFVVDNTPPVINTSIYKCGTDSHKTGTSVLSKSFTSGQAPANTFNLSNIQGNVSGWATSSNYPNGVCFEFNLSDNYGIKSYTWQWNDRNIKDGVDTYTTLPAANTSSETFNSASSSRIIEKSFTANGHRYGMVTVKDYAGNKTSMAIDLKLDNTGPAVPEITNTTAGNWVNTDVKLTLASSDLLNSMGDYFYTYNANATNHVTEVTPNTNWVKLTGGTGKASFTTEAWTTAANTASRWTVYLSASDNLNNYSAKSQTEIKIDKKKPTAPTIVNSSSGNATGAWTRNDVTLKLSSSDEHSGISEYYYSYNQNSTSYSDNTGANASNQWVKLEGGTNKTSFTTKPIFTTAEGTAKNVTVYVRSKDKAGNYSDVSSTKIMIDKVKPEITKLTNSSSTFGLTAVGQWTSQGVTLGLSASDSHSGIGNYYYSYSSNATSYVENQSQAGSAWVKLNGGTGQTSFTTEAWTGTDNDNFNKTVYITVCDAVMNCSTSKTTNIMIDKKKPQCGTIDVYDEYSNHTTKGVSGYVVCNETVGSGCSKASEDFSTLKETSYVTIKDKVGNTQSCQVPIDSYPEYYVCGEECAEYDWVCDGHAPLQYTISSAVTCSSNCGGSAWYHSWAPTILWENGDYYVCSTVRPGNNAIQWGSGGCCQCYYGCRDECVEWEPEYCENRYYYLDV